MVIVSISQTEIIDLRCGILIIRREIIDDGKIEDTIPDGLQARFKRNFFEGFNPAGSSGNASLIIALARRSLFLTEYPVRYRSTGYFIFARQAS
jgi:hypothetical protein